MVCYCKIRALIAYMVGQERYLVLLLEDKSTDFHYGGAQEIYGLVIGR